MSSNKNNIRNKVEKLYYNYGKFCASHPIVTLAGVICVIIMSCYPLLKAPFHSNTPFHQRKVLLNDLDNLYSNDIKLIGYVQQIIVHNSAVMDGVHDYNPIEIVYEALSECFAIVNDIKNREDYLDNCLETGDINADDENFRLFPTYSCLFLSPLQMWKSIDDRFWSDGNILRTINSQKRFIKEMFFGLPWVKTGLSGMFNKKKHHKINYAITFLLKKYNKKFLDDLFKKLQTKYNIVIHEPKDSGEEILYKDETFLSSQIPLLITYLILMLYVYFSVRKIEMVKSKLGLAFSACFTVAASLYMSLGICIYIGIIVPTLPGSEIFPYLVVIIGLENTLVVTKSVVATPVDLPVKHRIAQGLEKEGWAISKNLISEIFILSLGIFTFNPAIQEFFLLALIGLSTDFFLQITFFVTVLSIDMRRMELSDIRDCYENQLLHSSLNDESTIDSHLGKYSRDGFLIYLFRWIKHQLMSLANYYVNKFRLENNNIAKRHKRRASDFNTAAFIQSDGLVPVYIPRRLIFLYFWAKNRIFQRLVMIVAAIWILTILLYSTNLFHSVFQQNFISLSSQSSTPVDLFDDWKLLAMHNWPRLAQMYSINITNRKLFVLPSWKLTNDIKLSPKNTVRLNKFSKDQTNNWLSNQLLSGTNDLFMQIPSSLRGWADLSLTFKMVLASMVGVGIVLMSTAFIMTLFQALQSFSGENREPVLRILPLKIDSEFSVPPGAHSICCGSIIMASGIEIHNEIDVAFKIKSWNIDTGQLLDEKIKKGVWDIIFVDCWIVLGFDSGAIELWKRSIDNVELNVVDMVKLNFGGIMKLTFWLNEHCVFAATIDGWILMITIRNNKIHVINSTKVFSDSIKDFHVSNSYKVLVSSSRAIKMFQLPNFTLIESLSLISEPILATHFIDPFLAVSSGPKQISLIDTSNFKKITWNWSASVHWIKCCPATQRYKTTIVTFDVSGAICLWLVGRKTPTRQILISSPSVTYPGPVLLIGNCSLLFSDNGYLRLFNVHLNKYERSIQILGCKSIHISEVHVAAEKWIVCLNEQKDFIILPISTIK